MQGFALITDKFINELTYWIGGGRKVLEVMSGCGYISYCLNQKGIHIRATDNFSWKGMANWNADKNYWTFIENIDAVEAVKKYGKDVDVIIMSWPYTDNAYKVLL